METKKSYLDAQDLVQWQQALNENSKDLFDKLARVSKSTFILFNELKKNSDPDFNMAHVIFNSLTERQAAVLHKQLMVLCKAGIITKVRNSLPGVPQFTKQTYMINPYDLKCRKSNIAQELWQLNT